MRTRATYQLPDMMNQFDSFIVKRGEVMSDSADAMTKDYDVLSLLKFLYVLLGSSLTFAELHSRSNIKVKRSFLRHMNLCLEYDFVRKINTKINSRYYITYKGRAMLELFMQKNMTNNVT